MNPKYKFLLIFIFSTLNLWSQTQPPSSNVGFVTNDTIGCAPYLVNFHSVVSNCVSWYWNFGNGNTSSVQNPVEIYSNSGAYTVTLNVTYSDGSTQQFVRTNYISVANKPTPTFTVDIINNCENVNQFNFQNNTLGNNQYLWDFGDGNNSTEVSPLHQYNNAGNYTVTLFATNTNGCFQNTVMNNITIHTTTQNSFQINGLNQVCDSNHVFSFTALPNGMANYSWKFSDGTKLNSQNIQHSFNSSGTFDLTLITQDSNGCIDSTFTNNVVEIISLSNDFSAIDTVACISSGISFSTNVIGASSISWDFGDGSQGSGTSVNHTYNNTGQFDVTLTIDFANGCSQTITKNNYIEIINTPSANFQISDTLLCVNNPVLFSIQNTNAQSIKWIFGDGNSSTNQNYSHTYYNSGQFETKLVLNSFGCRDTLTNTINVLSAHAQFQNQTNHSCAPATVLFSDLSSSAISWSWIFSNGETSSDQNPTITFNTPGNYDAQLIITDVNGCSDTSFISDAVKISNKQPTNFQPSSFYGCAPLSISLYNFVTGSNTWLWNFGDGNFSYDSIPSHIYNVPGDYVVSLTTADLLGCYIYIDTFALVTVNQLIIDQIDISLNCSDSAATFNAYCNDCVSSLWDFGDNTTSNSLLNFHNYNAEINYFVSFTGVSLNGCTNTRLYSINLDSCTVNSIGGSASSPSEAESSGWSSSDTISERDPFYSFCGPISVMVNNPRPNAQSWEWHFGDGNTGYGAHPVHNYQTMGIYSLTLIYTDSSAIDTLYFHNFIEVLGHQNEIVINSVSTCNGLDLSLLSQNTSLTGYYWSIDNVLIQNNSPQLDTIFSSNNHLYSITLTTIDSNLCSISKSIGVLSEGMTPSLSYNSPICLGDSLTITHNILGYSRKWIFGDGSFSNLPHHVYGSEGIYDLSVELTDKYGCVKVIEIGEVNVLNPISNFTVLTPSLCKGDTVYIETEINPNYTYNWSIGNSNFISNDSTVSFVPNNSGVYDISLVVSQAHCATNSTQTGALTVNQALANFNFTQDSYCLPVTVQYNDLSNQAISWNWSFGDGNTSSSQYPINIFNSSPNSQVSLEILDINGCKAKKVKNNINLFNATIQVSSTTACAPEPIEFSENSQNAVQWFWDFGNGNTSTLANPTYTYQNEGTYDITLIATSADGCVDTVTNISMITIDKVIADYSLSNPSGCAPQPVYFTNNSQNAVSYYWDFGNGYSSTIENPIQVYHTGGNYTTQLIVESSSGCKDTLIAIPISIMGPSSNFDILENVVCDYDSIEFINLSQNASNYLWTFGDGTSSSNTNPTHQYSSSGIYNISLISYDVNGCQKIATDTTQISIIPKPNADFSLNDTIGCSPFELISTSQTNNMNYSWFLNGTLQSYNSTLETNLPIGNHDLSLIVLDQYGCSDTSSTIEIVVYESFSAELPALNSICETETQIIVNSPSTIGNWYINGFPNPNNIFDISLLSPGEHVITRFIDGYCGDSDSITLQIDALITATISPDLYKCEDDDEFLLYSSSNLGYWSGSGILNPYSGLVDPSFANYGENELSYTILNGACSFNDSITLTVYQKPNSNFTMSNEYNCEGYQIELNVPQNPISASYTWIVSNQNDTIVSYEIQPNLYFTPDTINIFLSVEDNGCLSVNSLSNIKVFDKSAPHSPEIIRSTVENNFVLTEWETPLYGKEKVSGYEILRSTDSINFSVIDWVPKDIFTYTDINTNVDSENYYYLIMPTNVCNVEPDRNNMSSSILLKKVDINGDNIQFSWSKYYKWKKGVDYYELQRKDNNGNWITIKKVEGTINNVIIERP